MGEEVFTNLRTDGTSMNTKNQTANSELVKADVVSFPVVGIGASAGGLEAFTLLLQHLPPDTGMGFVVVQHLDPVHESVLTKLLSKATSMAVHEVTNNLPVEPNHVYVIPPNTTLRIAHGVLKLGPRKQGRTSTRSIDSFFESICTTLRVLRPSYSIKSISVVR